MGLDESPYGCLGGYSADDVFKTCGYKTKKEKNCHQYMITRNFP